MTEADRGRFSAVMAGLGVAFDQEPSRVKLGLYWTALSDLRIEALEWGAKEAIRRLRFFPRAVELRELADLAPRPSLPNPGPAEAIRQIPDLMPVEEQRKRIAAMREELNARYGTTFTVDESRGRPVLAAGGGGER